MPKIQFVDSKSIEPIEVESGSNLMRSLLNANLPVASSCNGQGICSKCRIEILNGGENLSSESEFEKSLKEKNRVPAHFRISCQTKIMGDILIDTSYW